MNDRTNSSEIAVIASRDEADGEDVMGKHLPMILPWLLRVNHIDLVEPPPKLSEIVEFREGR